MGEQKQEPVTSEPLEDLFEPAMGDISEEMPPGIGTPVFRKTTAGRKETTGGNNVWKSSVCAMSSGITV